MTLIKLHEINYGKPPTPVLLPAGNIIDVKPLPKSMNKVMEGGSTVTYQGAWTGAFNDAKSLFVSETIEEILKLVNGLENNQ